MSIQRIRVPLGFLFGILFIYWSSPRPLTLITGLLVALAGLALRIWATGHLVKWEALAVSGPYSRTRNPLYLGSFLMGTGLTIASARPLLLVAFIALFAAIYLPVMRREEQELLEAYGDEFERYRQSVPLFFPRLRTPVNPGVTRFSWQRFADNREYNATVGLFLIAVFLWVKMSWI